MSWDIISPLLVFLLAAGLVVPLAKHARLNPMVSLLLVGVLVGPYGISELAHLFAPLSHIVIEESDTLHILAEFGVMSVLFVIGLEFSLARLMQLKRYVLGLGMLQVAITMAVITLVAIQFDNTLAAALIIGACLALSSTAMVSEILVQKNRLHTDTGKASIGILLAQDLAVVPFLVMVPLLAGAGEGSIAEQIGTVTFTALATIAGIMLFGRLLIRRALAMVAATGQRELMMGMVLLIILSLSMGTYAAGLSAALGAFMAGLMIAETPYRHSIAVDLHPFRGLLIGLFFMTVGMQINVTAVLDNLPWLFASVAGLAAIKAAIMFPLARAFGVPKHAAAETSITLAHGGEFAFVILGLAMATGVIPEANGQFMLLVAALSMFGVPVISNVAARLFTPPSHHQSARMPDAAHDHVLVVGYGRFGNEVAQALNAQDIPHHIIETDPARVETARSEGQPIYHGDASHAPILHALHIAHARALVIASEAPATALAIVRTARAAQADMPIFARARDKAHATALRNAGATRVIEESFEASLDLVASVLGGLNTPDDVIDTFISARKRDHYQPPESNT